jgi:hypothetical protein
MMGGYRHIPLSQRLGISFNENGYWRVDMAEAECFMYFIAGLRQIFGDSNVLYVEGTDFDQEVEAFYKGFAKPKSTQIMRLLRHPRARAYHMPLSKEAHKTLSRLATTKTFSGICDALLVYENDRVVMDGSRIAERMVLFSGELPESKIKKFCATRVHGTYEWIEDGSET